MPIAGLAVRAPSRTPNERTDDNKRSVRVAVPSPPVTLRTPRGVITAGAAEPNALVELREGGRKEANTRATMVELYDGLVAKSQNNWPSLNFDVGALTSLASSV